VFVFLALLFLGAAIAMAAVAAGLNSQLDEERGDRREVERAAAQLASRLLTYDYRDLDTARARVLELATGTFRREYEDAFGGLKELLTTTKATSTGDVQEVFIGELSGRTASAIVVVDTTAEGVSGRRQTFASYIQLDLVKAEGEWLVAGVTNLNFGQTQAGDRPPAGATTTAPTSTTAPPN
jgi:Mce-associated membrane protein